MNESVAYLIVDGEGVITATGEIDPSGFAMSFNGRPDVRIVADRTPFQPGDRFAADGTLVKITSGVAIVEGQTITALPIPCEISVDRADWIAIADGEAAIETDFPGTYLVGIRSDRTLFQEVWVTTP